MMASVPPADEGITIRREMSSRAIHPLFIRGENLLVI
jgi:hypothetical protein